MTKKILIIEDNPDIALALNEVLSDSGYRIDVASNGKEGLDHLINRDLPDLILLDLFLPVMNGYEFRLRQMKIPYLSQIPVIVMSADACVRNRCRQLNVDHFLKKPFELGDLLNFLTSLLSVRKE